jgi:hypothetical protein
MEMSNFRRNKTLHVRELWFQVSKRLLSQGHAMIAVQGASVQGAVERGVRGGKASFQRSATALAPADGGGFISRR